MGFDHIWMVANIEKLELLLISFTNMEDQADLSPSFHKLTSNWD